MIETVREKFTCRDCEKITQAIDFEKSIVWIKWIGAHKDYDLTEVEHDK